MPATAPFASLPNTNPSGLNPAANIGGFTTPPAPGASASGGSFGSSNNPMLPTVPGGTQTGSVFSPLSFPANGTPPTLPAPGTTGAGPSPVAGANNPAIGPAGAPGTLYNTLGGGQNLQGIINALNKTGLPGGISSLLAGFLQSGAGFNPQAANMLFAAMQPQIERGTESIAEQFSAMGNRFSSGAQIGEADYLSQVNLNMDQILANMYQQSIQNYLSVLMGVGKKQPTFGQQFAGSFANQLGSTLGGGGLQVGLSF